MRLNDARPSAGFKKRRRVGRGITVKALVLVWYAWTKLTLWWQDQVLVVNSRCIVSAKVAFFPLLIV